MAYFFDFLRVFMFFFGVLKLKFFYAPCFLNSKKDHWKIFPKFFGGYLFSGNFVFPKKFIIGFLF
jgi:hypothetical protein